MHLRPVVLAPRPQTRTAPSRRGFLIAGAGLASAALFGGVCGFSLGTTARPALAAQGHAGTGDVELDELRRLAVDAPLEELLAQHRLFLMLRERNHADDEVLWQGVARLCDAVVDGAKDAERGPLVGLLLATMRVGAPPAALRLPERAAALARMRR